MDQRVLEAQQWVNATYTTVPGYERCEENGKTGWATMFSLTRGLQRELGITELSDTFGPTTMGLIAAQGPINQGYSRNANIVRIIQHGLFCKGYDAGETQTGKFHAGTALGVVGLKGDIGLIGTDATVDPKIFKAILNMDAYLMLSGGRQQVRSIQQWLNGKYLNRSTFTTAVGLRTSVGRRGTITRCSHMDVRSTTASTPER